MTDRRYAKPSFCPECGYDMRASFNRCPECGWLIPKRRPVPIGRIPPRPGETGTGIITESPNRTEPPPRRLFDYHNRYTRIARPVPWPWKVWVAVVAILMWSCIICGSIVERG
jgi:hypothetical protein